MLKKWILKQEAPPEFIQQFSDYHPLIAQLLYNRGLKSQSEIDYFFKSDWQGLEDPFLFRDMRKIVNRLWQAIDKQEKILIHGDYDADGVTSAAVLYKCLKMLKVEAQVFVPHRENDGYGINMKNAKQFVKQKIDLLITVDCGITNLEEIAYLSKNGVEVIVTDHHEPLPELPMALGIINPKVKQDHYPFAYLSGAGVAFKLAQALFSDERIKKHETDFNFWGGTANFIKWLLDIVAIGTVADVMPLIGENRILVKWGLIVLGKTKHPGLKFLLDNIENGARLDTYTIGYQIAPRLNAAGRIDHAELAFKLLVTEEPTEAEILVKQLQDNNSIRQRLIDKALLEAREQVSQNNASRSLFLYNSAWAPGLIGLIAGRLADEMYKPVFAMTLSNGKVVGSGRSIEELHITEMLGRVTDFLERYGGHAGACGFTLHNQAQKIEFEKVLSSNIESALGNAILEPSLNLDVNLNLKELSIDLIEKINSFAPFGEGNEKPYYQLDDLRVVAVDCLGKEQNHLRFLVKQNDGPQLFKMLWFGKAKDWKQRIQVGHDFSAACEIGINEWGGRREIEIKIIDLKFN